jgi:DNA-binding transcriptional ArsR family regulator
MASLVSQPQPISAFKALGDEARWQIMRYASSVDEVCRGDLQVELALSKPALMNHLGVLTAAGLLHRRHVGRVTYYSVNPAVLVEASRALTTAGQQSNAQSRIIA